MSTVTLSLAEPASEWLAQRVEMGGWPSKEAYLADLIERDREEAEQLAALKTAVDEGLASGVSDLTFADILKEARDSLAHA